MAIGRGRHCRREDTVQQPLKTIAGDVKTTPVQQTWPIDRSFDASFVDSLARLESFNKHHYRPNSYLHKWWARRCGSTFRAILKGLVEDEERRGYYSPGGLEGKVILDPMCGGGTTLHEAIRMGANVVGVDLEPIPVLQIIATLTPIDLQRLETSFAQLFDALTDELSSYYQTECPRCDHVGQMRYTLYGLQRRCDCGPVVLVDSLILRYEHGQPAIRLCPHCRRPISAAKSCRCAQAGGSRPTLLERDNAHCSRCGSYREVDAPFYRRYVPLVIVGDCPGHGLFYKALDSSDVERIQTADDGRLTLELVEKSGVEAGPKSRDLLARGVTSYLDLLSSRQLLYMLRATRHLRCLPPDTRLPLALLISTSLEFNSMLCGYKGARVGDRPGAIRHAFSYHAYTFPYTAVENNPLNPLAASGTLQKLFHDRVRRARQWSRAPRERRLNGDHPFRVIHDEVDFGRQVYVPEELSTGSRRFLVSQGSATRLPLPDQSVDFIVTDPPYFDSVQYSDLARFFHVWLRRMLPDAGQWDLPGTQAAVAPSANGNNHYGVVLAEILRECRRVLRSAGGRLIFTYHHWSPKAWAALTTALIAADFALINRYVVHSENPTSVHIANLRALTHDAILVLAPSAVAGDTAWMDPGKADSSDSHQFTQDCATLLGHLLRVRPDPAQVCEAWARAIA